MERREEHQGSEDNRAAEDHASATTRARRSPARRRAATTTIATTSPSSPPPNPRCSEHLLQQLSLTGLTQRDKHDRELRGRPPRRGRLPHAKRWRSSARRRSPRSPTSSSRTSRSRSRTCSNLEPSGVGARDLAECLGLQLRALPESTPYRDAAITLVARHLDVARRARLQQAEAPAAGNLGRRPARSARAHPHARPEAGARLRRGRHALRGARRAGAQVRRPLARHAQPRCDAAAAHQQDVRRHPAGLARQRRQAPRRATAGGALAHQERAAALRHDPARHPVDRGPPAAISSSTAKSP